MKKIFSALALLVLAVGLNAQNVYPNVQRNGALTSGRVPIITTSGVLVDSSLFTFNGTILTAPSATLTATSSLLLGSAGSAVGNIGFRNATSGTATLGPPTGALGTYTVTLPNNTSTLPIFGQQATFAGLTAARTITLLDLNYTTARQDAAQTFTGIQSFTSPDFTTSVTTPSTTFTAFAGATTLMTIGGTGASASSFFPSTLDATTSTTGAIRTSGGISAAKAANFGTTLNVAGISGLGVASSSTTNVNLPAGTTGVSPLRIAQGVAPTSPVNGDVWTTSTGMFVQIAGGTVGPFGSGGGSVANPTGLVGLTAVNGASGSAIRADGAPALDQSIAPTWTGVHTFTPAARASGVAPYLKITIPTDTGITAATEGIGYQHATGTRTWATTGTVPLQREVFFAGPTYASAGASQTFTDAFNLYATPPIAGTNAIFTRNHTFGIVDSTSAASSITGGLVVATTLGTTATSVGIGGGNVNAGGLITGGTVTSTGTLTATAALSVGTTLTATGGASSLANTTVAGAAATTALTITQTARTSGILPYIKYTIPTDTAQTASTESPGIVGVTGTRTWATTGTVALQREIFFPGPTYASASASQTFTDAFNMYLTPPVAGTNAIFTRGHSLGIVDSTSAASSITGGLVVATTLGTTATSVGVGGGNINAGGSITAGGALTATGTTTLNGANTLSTVARSSGAASYLTVTTPADTNQTLSTEAIGANFTAATRQWATGTLATQRERVFGAPTYGFVGASTLTTAINVDIADPVAGTNATFTNGYALRSGKSLFTGEVITPASTTTTAGLNLPHGAAPTSPVNGDVWTTTSGLSARINGSTINYGSSSISGLTTTALVTANGTTAIQTPSATATMDSSGNISTPGTVTVGNAATTAGAVAFTQGTTQSTGTTNVTIQAPTSVPTSFIVTLPGAVGSNLGIWQQTVSGSVATIAPTVNPQITTVELGAASDTTLSRDSAGVIAVEGNIVSMVGARKTTITSSATPTFDIRTCDVVNITALATAITSMTSSMTITGVQDFQQLEFRILDNGTARAITWGANFAAGPTALPTTTTLGKALTVWFEYDAVQAKFMCMSAGSYP